MMSFSGRLLRRHVRAHHARHRALIGERQRPIAERLRLLHQLVRMRGAAQEGEVRKAVQLGVRGAGHGRCGGASAEYAVQKPAVRRAHAREIPTAARRAHRARCSNRARSPAPSHQPLSMRSGSLTSRSAAAPLRQAVAHRERLRCRQEPQRTPRRRSGAVPRGARRARRAGRRRVRSAPRLLSGPVFLEQRQPMDRPVTEPRAQPLDEAVCLTRPCRRRAHRAATASGSRQRAA